ncbi:carbamoyltransferase, partial [Halorubrum sp. SD626R]|uniref:carbamoyltransferase C-terminal domain-containing protein n=1 Tax=Halorubrum sp. SD626R TaxID=1419722 RepID=UPI00113A342A
PAVLHPEDHTARPQIVSESQNARLYAIIEEFEKRTGVPVLLNTSFNDHGDPIVRTPKEAIQTYISSGLDVLVLEDLILVKNNV